MSLCSDIDLCVLERSEARVYRLERGGVMNAMFGETENRALDGQPIMFNTPFRYGNDIVLFKPGAFGDLANDKVDFRIDHIDSSTVASTDDALSLVVDDESIQFRLELHKCKRGAIIARMCEIDNRASMSVGCDLLEEHREEIAGHSVRVVTRAKLKEISLCKDGAAIDAFAVLVDTCTPKPIAGSRTATFNAAHAFHKVARKFRQLKAQVIAAYDDSPRVKRPFTLQQSNRWQTERTERLQRHARRVHCI